MIKATNLSKSFGPTTAVNKISFEIGPGEVVGLLGPNGAGKTTTMRLLTGYLFPDEGKIEIDNVSVTENPIEAKLSIGYLPENNPLYEEMLVAELLDFSAKLKGIPKKKRREAFEFAVDSVGIDEVFYRPIGELSKGFRQRVGLALALLHQPRFLIMDEPTEGLDPNQRGEIRTLIRELARDRTVIMSTHVMQEASAVCNRLMIINQGKLVADGSPEELSSRTGKEKTIILELEGDKIKPALTSLKGVKRLDFSKAGPRRQEVKLLVEKDREIRPALSQLIHERRWTIWKLTEEEQRLEDIFRQLTTSESSHEVSKDFRSASETPITSAVGRDLPRARPARRLPSLRSVQALDGTSSARATRPSRRVKQDG